MSKSKVVPLHDDADLGAVTEMLAESAKPTHTLPEARMDALWARVGEQIGFADEHAYFSAEDGDWRVLGDGVDLKVFERDPETGMATYLVRYGAGASFPKHPQKSREECVLVSGDLRIGDQEMRPGDLQVAAAGIEHGPLVSQGGALVYVRGALSMDPDSLPLSAAASN